MKNGRKTNMNPHQRDRQRHLLAAHGGGHRMRPPRAMGLSRREKKL